MTLLKKIKSDALLKAELQSQVEMTNKHNTNKKETKKKENLKHAKTENDYIICMYKDLSKNPNRKKLTQTMREGRFQ